MPSIDVFLKMVGDRCLGLSQLLGQCEETNESYVGVLSGTWY